MGDELKVSARGADRLARTTSTAARALGIETKREARRAARKGARTARGLAPRRTATLAGTITLTPSGSGFIAGRGIRYAGYQEYGTRNNRARPYMRPGLKVARVEYTQGVKKAIHKQLKTIKGI